LALFADDEMVGDARQVGMAQVRQDDSFQPELARMFIRRKEVFLYGYFYTQVFVYGAGNRVHPPWLRRSTMR